MIESFAFPNFPTSPHPIKLEKESSPSTPPDANDTSFELPLQKKRGRKTTLPNERKEKNRLSALAHRQRTKALIEELQENYKKLKEKNYEQALLIATLQGRLHELQQTQDRDLARIYKAIESLKQQLSPAPCNWAIDDLFTSLVPAIEAPQQE